MRKLISLFGISYPPPGLEPRKPLKSFGFRGFALIPFDCRFPPGTLRFDTFGPDPPRVSHIGTDDSENAFEPSPAVCSSSQRIPVGPARRFPLTPSDERHTNAYGCHEGPFEPSINSLMHRQEAEERSSVGWARGETGRPYRRQPPPGIRQRTAPAPP